MVKKSIGLKALILPLALALIVMMIIFFIKPVFSEMMANRNSLETKRGELAKLQEQSRKLNQLKESMLSMEDRNLISVALPESVDVEDYLNEFYQRAARSGVLVSDFAISDASSLSQPSYVCGVAANSQAGTVSSSGAGTGATNPNTTLDNSGTDATAFAATSSCVLGSAVSATLKGSWDQILSFYQYLFDTNRIANVREISLAVGLMAGQALTEEAKTDLLETKVSLNIFYKPKSEMSDSGTVNTLAGSGEIKADVLKKLADEIIYSPYEAPSVSESGERNIFK
ncbi:MAG: hypothetical protein A3J76_03450 [Candidatus Moranbacteria bacterium RBG_13_45_13]|nr:MAG: hypothetical protein A3J76_03450 [Candidatus Moranbacteria bacterium RBG_13_45_13]